MNAPMHRPDRFPKPVRSLALRLALLLIVAGGCLAGSAAAQAPDGAAATYSLTWWTVGGGGASFGYSGYTLGGTAGQPDAAVPRSGGVYTLRAGFWQEACTTAAAVTPGIARSGSTVTLSWTPNAGNQAYQVHRGTTPYFTPAAGTLQETVTRRAVER